MTKHTSKAEQPVTATPENGKGHPYVWGISAIAIAGVIGWASLQYYPSHLDDETKTGVETAVFTPEADPAPVVSKPRAAAGSEMDRLRNRLADLEERVRELEGKAGSPQSAALRFEGLSKDGEIHIATTLTSLNQKLEALETEYKNKEARHNAALGLVQTLHAITERVEQGASYDDLMPIVKKAAHVLQLETADSVRILSNHAETPPRTLLQLIQQFAETAPLALPASIRSQQEASFSDKLRGYFGHIIAIRRVGNDVDGHNDEALIAHAENAIHEGDVNTAITHIEQLSPDTAAIFSPWLEEAHAYQSMHDAIALLHESLTVTPDE